MDPMRRPEGLPAVLSTEEVAALLRLNRTTVLAMARDGRLPAHRLPGCRKVQYLAAEVLAALAKAPLGDDVPAKGETSSGHQRAGIDPCDVWGPTPAESSGDQLMERCRTHWVELARKAGLFPVSTAQAQPEGPVKHQSAGLVEIDGLLYDVLVGPRQRTRYVDDEGDSRWGLIDAVWVEPVSAVAFGGHRRASVGPVPAKPEEGERPTHAPGRAGSCG